MQQDLTEQSFLLFAAKHYDNPHCHTIDEFHYDLQIPMHLKKLFTRYATNKVLKERLIINHIISFFNVFEPHAAAKILFFRMEEKYHSYLKTVLTFLNRCPDKVVINGETLEIFNIEIDTMLMHELEKNVC